MINNTSAFSLIHGVESKMNGSTVILTKRLIMYSEECQIQTLSAKNGKKVKKLLPVM